MRLKDASHKKAITIISSLAIGGLMLTSCSASSNDGENAETVLRLSHFMDPNHPIETCGMATLNESLEGSGISVETYPSSQLGGESESLEQVYSGNLDMSINGPNFLGVYDERMNVLDAAYVFEDPESQRDYMLSGDVDELLDGFQEKTGIKTFPGWYYGTRHVTSNVPINEPSDLSGIKLRTPDSPLFRINITAMGGNPTPLALDELYMALQQGVVDAQENPLPTIKTMNLQEVQDYINLTGHMVASLHISVAESTWAALDDSQQDALTKAIEEGATASYECVTEQEDEILAEFSSGSDIEINDIDITAFKDRVREELSNGQSFSDEYLSIIESQE